MDFYSYICINLLIIINFKKMVKKKSTYTGKYTCLYSKKEERVHVLRELYEKDNYKARILYMNNPTDYIKVRVGLFEEKNGDFSLVYFVRTYGISKTNIWYSREKRLTTISYKGGKFWLINNFNGKYVTHLSLSTFSNIPEYLKELMLSYLSSKFSWINFMIEHNVLREVSFNTIVSKKLYSLRKALVHQYKVPYPTAKLIHKASGGHGYHTAVNMIYYVDYLKNVENLREEWFDDSNQRSIFHDSLKMGRTLNKQVNCSWSNKRLKIEHDKWSEEISDVIFIDGNRDMKINEVFIDFASVCGYQLLTTTKEMAIEGKRNSHCVASYISIVERSYSAIYRIGEYTLELVRQRFDSVHALKIGQLRGYKNIPAPDYIREGIMKNVIRYNKDVIGIEAGISFYGQQKWGEIPLNQVDDIFEDGFPF